MGILRLLLALSVVFAHSTSFFGYSFVGGEIAVKAFYIISGFYMSLILNEKYVGKNNSYKLFISNRFLRLYPIYWVVMIMTILFSVFSLLYTNYNDPLKLKCYLEYYHSMSFGSIIFLIFSNIFIFFQDIIMFMGYDIKNGTFFLTENFRNSDPALYSFLFVPQAWTIAIELTFYLIAPFILRKKLPVIIVIIIFSAVLKIYLWQKGYNYDPWTYRFFPLEIMYFMFGNVSYRLYQRLKVKKINISLAFTSLVLMVISTVLYYNYQFVIKTYIYFIVFILFLPYIFMLTKKWKVDTFIGDLSYPIYICHGFIILIFNFIYDFKINGWQLAIFSIVFSVLLNEVVAKPIERIRQRRLAA
jgi:peptidoglycan/LPS O-acetylase OafA/YrhL